MPQPQSKSNPREKALIALGGNLASTHGRPAETLSLALDALEQAGIAIDTVSRFYRTPCFPPGAGPDFVNAAASIITDLAPDVLLARFHEIEGALGRVRETRWGARVVDLDLIAMGDRILPDRATVKHWMGLPLGVQKAMAPDRLILPHPRLQDRGFVLIPLADVAPDWCHPLSGRTVAEMVAALPEAEIRDIVALSQG